MDFLDHTASHPAENLAVDEALLDAAEAGERGESLRFWESPVPFVVLGHSNRMGTEVNARACADLGIPVLRRCSGGGAVLQGPGSLNYALILQIDARPQLNNVTSANCFIMSSHAEVLAKLTGEPVRVAGVTDLQVDGRKVSGNAQRRRRRYLLFHGTLLLAPDLELMEVVLPLPPRMPDYRQQRGHTKFLGRINSDSSSLKQAWRDAWGAAPSGSPLPLDRVRRLVTGQYGLSSWTEKF